MPTATRTKPPLDAKLYPGNVLLLTIAKKVYGYYLAALPHDLGPRARCYRLRKFASDVQPGEPDHYDISLTPGRGNGSACECLGWLRHWHCKHIDALTALHADGKLF